MKIINRVGLELDLQFPFYIVCEHGDYGTNLVKINSDKSTIQIQIAMTGEIDSLLFENCDEEYLSYITKQDYDNQSANKEKFETATQKLKEIIGNL